MRTFTGIAVNFSYSLIGKIISEAVSPHATEPDAHVFIFNDPTGGSQRTGLLLNSSSPLFENCDSPVFKLLGENYVVEKGDVILLTPNGEGTVLYERKSRSNAVLVTNRCNSHCITCPQPPQPDQEDLADFSSKIISLIDPDLEVLGITGGEPTLNWEGLLKVVSASRKFLPNTSIQLLTNARLLKDFVKTKELAELAEGNLFACVPLYGDVDTIHDEIVGVSGAFWETVEGLYNLARVGICVELRTVIMQSNYSRLEKWAEFVYRTFPFVDHVALMGLEPIGLAAENINKVWIDPADYARQLEKSVKSLHRRGLNVSIYNHQICTLPESLWPFARKSISEWKNIYFRECEGCKMQPGCGGFFHSAQTQKSRAISAFS